MRFRGKYEGFILRRHRIVSRFEMNNAVVNAGLDNILDVCFKVGTQAATWHMGLIDDAATLSNTDTMASHAGWTEVTTYDEADRPAWTPGYLGVGQIGNITFTDFTMNSAKTLYGIFIVDDNQKGLAVGNLWSTAKFSGGDKTVEIGDVVRVLYSLTAGRG
jgi:hypothetical protein